MNGVANQTGKRAAMSLSRILSRLRKTESEGPRLLDIDLCTKFHRCLYVRGRSRGGAISAIKALGDDVAACSTEIAGNRFTAQILFGGDVDLNVVIEATLADNTTAQVQPVPATTAKGLYSGTLEARFKAHVAALPGAKVIDVGGRNRSKLDRSREFTTADVCVLDVLPGENVDVVGDAHGMSALFEPESFDAAYSIAVFEHLLMPWRVVIELNAIMKPGAIGYVQTHQTIGMHDLPWDFWRYSNTAWDALFNEYTGFEIIDRELYSPQFILPFILTPGKMDAEMAAGYEGSSVLFRKIGPSRVEWDVPTDIISTMYPA